MLRQQPVYFVKYPEEVDVLFFDVSVYVKQRRIWSQELKIDLPRSVVRKEVGVLPTISTSD